MQRATLSSPLPPGLLLGGWGREGVGGGHRRLRSRRLRTLRALGSRGGRACSCCLAWPGPDGAVPPGPGRGAAHLAQPNAHLTPRTQQHTDSPRRCHRAGVSVARPPEIDSAAAAHSQQQPAARTATQLGRFVRAPACGSRGGPPLGGLVWPLMWMQPPWRLVAARPLRAAHTAVRPASAGASRGRIFYFLFLRLIPRQSRQRPRQPPSKPRQSRPQ
jgi:hypothetical protein